MREMKKNPDLKSKDQVNTKKQNLENIFDLKKK